MSGILNLGTKRVRNRIHVNGIAAEKNFLFTVDSDHQPRLGNLINGLRVRHSHVNARLNNRRGQHKDNEQHQHHIDKRSDVDVGKRGLCATLGIGKCHVLGTYSVVIPNAAFSAAEESLLTSEMVPSTSYLPNVRCLLGFLASL